MFHVKHSDAIDAQDLETALHAAGVQSTVAQRSMLVSHAQSVLHTNRTTNLTRIVQPTAVIRLHILDSLAFLPFVSPLSGPLVDIGSGAGYPGVPIAVMTGLQVTLCEANRRKAAFLSSFVLDQGLPARVFHGRAEDLARAEPEIYSTALARAVAGLPSLVELAAPLLAMGGCFIALKGEPSPDEVSAGSAAGALCGMAQKQDTPYVLQGGNERRRVIVYERVARPSVHLPRRVGMAQTKPLG